MKELLKRQLDAFAASDWTAYKADLAPDMIMEEIPTGRRAKGADEVVELVKFWKRAFPDAKATLLQTFSFEDKLIAELEWEGTQQGSLETPFGTLPATNKRVRVRAALINTLRDGKVAETHHYFDVMTMMVQLGAGARPTTPSAEAQPPVH